MIKVPLFLVDLYYLSTFFQTVLFCFESFTAIGNLEILARRIPIYVELGSIAFLVFGEVWAKF